MSPTSAKCSHGLLHDSAVDEFGLESVQTRATRLQCHAHYRLGSAIIPRVTFQLGPIETLDPLDPLDLLCNNTLFCV
jgi:hypothetical protein